MNPFSVCAWMNSSMTWALSWADGEFLRLGLGGGGSPEANPEALLNPICDHLCELPAGVISQGPLPCCCHEGCGYGFHLEHRRDDNC